MCVCTRVRMRRETVRKREERQVRDREMREVRSHAENTTHAHTCVRRMSYSRAGDTFLIPVKVLGGLNNNDTDVPEKLDINRGP